ncbi:MAG: hypothetical protein ACRERV_03240 [Methylococcales bacterium]
MFCGRSLLACVLRASRIDGAKHAAAGQSNCRGKLPAPSLAKHSLHRARRFRFLPPVVDSRVASAMRLTISLGWPKTSACWKRLPKTTRG